jgi:Mg-chelatase subunit ChlD
MNNGIFKPAVSGLAARKAAAAQANKLANIVAPKTAEEMEQRIGIVFDDSGSMRGALRTAKDGCEEFLRSCTKDQTAVCVYPLGQPPLQLSCNLPAIALLVEGIGIGDTTPLVQTLNKMLESHNLTRAIAFSDGKPDSYREVLYESILSKKIPVDTVYLQTGGYSNDAANFMRKLAEDTGGVFLEFKAGQSNFATAFKYLSPGLRYMLADKSFVANLEGR